jgi:hypothetical protein
MNTLDKLLHAKEHLITNRYWSEVNIRVPIADEIIRTQAKKQGLLVIAEESPA